VANWSKHFLLRNVSLVFSLAMIALPSGAIAQSAQDVPLRGCPNLMDYYPQQALRKGIGGRVSYALSVDLAGKVLEITVTESSGQAMFDNAGMKFLQRCRFVSTANLHSAIRKTVRTVIFSVPDN